MTAELTDRQSTIARQMARLVAENGGEGITADEAARRLCVRRSEITPAVIEAASIRFASAHLAV